MQAREVMHRWEFADDLQKASPFSIDYPSHIHFITRLNAHGIALFDHALYRSPFVESHEDRDRRWC